MTKTCQCLLSTPVAAVVVDAHVRECLPRHLQSLWRPRLPVRMNFCDLATPLPTLRDRDARQPQSYRPLSCWRCGRAE